MKLAAYTLAAAFVTAPAFAQQAPTAPPASAADYGLQALRLMYNQSQEAQFKCLQGEAANLAEIAALKAQVTQLQSDLAAAKKTKAAGPG